MTAEPAAPPAAIRVDLGAVFVSLELSKSIWLVRSLSPGSEKMSRHSVPGGDLPALLACLNLLREKAEAREGRLCSATYVERPAWQGHFSAIHPAGTVRSYVRPISAVLWTAGLDEVRETSD